MAYALFSTIAQQYLQAALALVCACAEGMLEDLLYMVIVDICLVTMPERLPLTVDLHVAKLDATYVCNPYHGMD